MGLPLFWGSPKYHFKLRTHHATEMPRAQQYSRYATGRRRAILDILHVAFVQYQTTFDDDEDDVEDNNTLI